MKKILILAICLSASALAQGQSLLAASGNHYANGNLQLSYSLGELAVATLTTQDATVTQGFHQNQDFATHTRNWDGLDVLIYPNPFTDRIHLQLSEAAVYQLNLYEVSGRLVYQERSYLVGEHIVEVSRLAKGMYILQLVSEQGDRSAALPIQKMR